jgi:uncharacterized membrane protein YsdA (DUF1294 family)/cold shock CspA family protein
VNARKPPRYQGKITSWKDEQGFGFITPNGGGATVFVHVKSFSRGGARPANESIVTYELGTNEKGQPRAENVAFARDRITRPVSTNTAASANTIAAVFFALIALLVLSGKLPGLFFGLYLGLSAVAFLAYRADKSAARNHQWRIAENTLHMLGLFGGWPGALVARQVLRHKSTKESFRAGFRLTVVVNCGFLLWLLSPWGANTLEMLGLR